ncbi:MAG: EAL domain-containing protein [Parvularculaceae bacterium]|nr:EAL domain-containing protein [Parvularculaceae bacterium]
MGAQAVRLSNVDIDNALKSKEFEVLFQPIFDLGNGALARVETFIRWRHPSLGVLPPGAFISFFESQGRMSELTRYVLGEALSAYEGWRGANPPGFSINLALTDLSDESFASHFTVLLRERAFPPELITLECPMPAVDADMETTARQLQRLSDTGARLAIEVRGRANDFLKTIRPFPFAEIKTGGAAILRFARTVRGPGLSAISELLELAAEQNAAITAVGVEDQASLSALRGLGFAAAQGNHLARVGSLDQFMPSHVNDVRALMGLEALSSDDLVALFRTGGPTPGAAEYETENADAGENKGGNENEAATGREDDWREGDAGGAPEDMDADAPEADAPAQTAPDPESAREAETGSDAAPYDVAADADAGSDEPVSRKRSKPAAPARPAASDDELVERLARRLALSGGDKAGDADEAAGADAKAAAIVRARRRSLLKKKLAARNALAAKAKARAEAEQAAPRDMQERLSREFGIFADEEAAPSAQRAETAAAGDESSAPENDWTDQTDEIDVFSPEAESAESPAQDETANAAANADAIGARKDAEPGAEPDAEAQGLAARAMSAAKLFDMRIGVSGALARFTPTIRVSTPELSPPDDTMGDLGDLDEGEPSARPENARQFDEDPARLDDPATDDRPAPAGDAALEDAAIADAGDAARQDEIPEPMSNARWLEDSVAVESDASEDEESAGSNAIANLLTRKYRLPKYSGYFWPRPVRKWMKRRQRRIEKIAAE